MRSRLAGWRSLRAKSPTVTVENVPRIQFATHSSAASRPIPSTQRVTAHPFLGWGELAAQVLTRMMEAQPQKVKSKDQEFRPWASSLVGSLKLVAGNCDEMLVEGFAVAASAGIGHWFGGVLGDGEKLAEGCQRVAVAEVHGGTAAALRQVALGCQLGKVGGLVHRLALDVPWSAAAEDIDAVGWGLP